MTYTIQNKTVSINGIDHTVTAVDGLDRVDINTKLHYLNVEMDKLKAKQSELVHMREMIDHQCEMIDQCEMRERAESADDLFNDMFGG